LECKFKADIGEPQDQASLVWGIPSVGVSGVPPVGECLVFTNVCFEPKLTDFSIEANVPLSKAGASFMDAQRGSL